MTTTTLVVDQILLAVAALSVPFAIIFLLIVLAQRAPWLLGVLIFLVGTFAFAFALPFLSH